MFKHICLNGSTDSSGNPIENARVNLRRADNKYGIYQKTDEFGVASFEVVPMLK